MARGGRLKIIEQETGRAFEDVLLERLNATGAVTLTALNLGISLNRTHQLIRRYGFKRRCVWVRVAPADKETAS